MADTSMLWRRLDQPGHEAARLFSQDSHWHLAGTAVFAHDHLPCRLDYLVVCTSDWRTVSGKVAGWIGDDTLAIEISVDETGRWRLNGQEHPELAGCIDLDLNFSPSTNLLPIRRLELKVGQEAEVKAAWLRFPSFAPEPLVQRYRRVGRERYGYESGGGKFGMELTVNGAAFVTDYPNAWQAEPPAGRRCLIQGSHP